MLDDVPAKADSSNSFKIFADAPKNPMDDPKSAMHETSLNANADKGGREFESILP
jgi:hypothetical protein